MPRLAPPALAVLAALALAAPAAGAVAVDTCTEAEGRVRPRIEVLPFLGTGDTCAPGLTSTRQSYGETCGLQSFRYTLPDDVYRVRLNAGNRVSFRLREAGRADHVLALLRGCDAAPPGEECIAASLDFLDPEEDETIRSDSYPPGDYYLLVDSADDARCGGYTLTVSGTNPVPELGITLGAAPRPVVAGTELTYALELANTGALDASGVEVDLWLPAGVRPRPPLPAGCGVAEEGRLRCSLETLPMGSTEAWALPVEVDPVARGVRTARARAVAVEGEPTPVVAVETEVRAVTDLRLGKAAATGAAIAGCPLVYTLSVVNRGPSTATGVVVRDELPAAVVALADPPLPGGLCPPVACPPSSVPCRPGAAAPGARLLCEVGSLPPGAPAVEVCLPVRVAPGAPAALNNRAAVTGAAGEEDPPPGNAATVRTAVERETDLALTKRAVDTVDGAVRGDAVTYELAVRNAGPSDSSGAEVRDELPAGVSLRTSAAGCRPQGGGVVVCPVAPAAGRETVVAFTAGVDVAAAPRTLVNRARVVPAAGDRDPDEGNDAGAATVRVEADVSLGDALSLEPAEVPAGGYLQVVAAPRNLGPSDAPPAVVTAVVAGPGVRFLASPDGCTPRTDPPPPPDTRTVECPAASIAAGGTSRHRFVVRVPPTAGAGEAVSVEAAISVPGGKDPEPGNDTARATATVVTRADLAAAVTAEPEPVAAGGDITYAIGVANAGPSDATGVRLRACRTSAVEVAPPLPPRCVDDPLPAFACPGEAPCAGREVCCELADLAAGEERSLALTLRAPGSAGAVIHEVEISATTVDPEAGNDRAAVSTAVVEPAAVVLVPTVLAAADPLVAGDPARFTVTVEHRGPADTVATDVAVSLALSGPVAGLLELPADCVATTTGALRCPLGALARGEWVEVGLAAATPRVGSGAVALTARVVADAAPEAPSAAAEARLIDAPDLLLPAFRVDPAPGGRAALLAVHGRGPPAGAMERRVEVGYRSSAGTPLGRETRPLAPRGVLTGNVRDGLAAVGALGGGTVEGTVTIDLAAPPDAPRERLLTGDLLRAEPPPADAAGTRLVDTDSGRRPRQLCRRWSTRLPGLGGGSEFLFWLASPASAASGERQLRGRVYTAAGELVQELRLALDVPTFRLDSGRMLAGSGSVEWELPAGQVGYVSAVHRTAAGGGVELPAVCLDGAAEDRQPGRDHPLLLPFFLLDGPPPESTTRLTVRNGAAEPAAVTFRYHRPEGGGAVYAETCILAPRAVRSVDLRRLGTADPRCEGPDGGPALAAGYVEIAAVPAAGADGTGGRVFLSGDWLRSAAGGAVVSGAALVDADPGLAPLRICRRWRTRLLDGGTFGGETAYIVHLPGAPAGIPFGGEAYDEAGAPLGTISRTAPGVAFEMRSGDLGLGGGGNPDAPLFGSIEWTLPDAHPGYVATLHRTAGGVEVLLPGTCVEP